MATYNYQFGNTGSIQLQPGSTNLLWGIATIVYTYSDPNYPAASLTLATTGHISFYQPGQLPENLPGAADFYRGSITNFGGIQNLSGVGVRFYRGGDITNYGTINGDSYAIEQRSAANNLDVTITNAGLIVGTTAITLQGTTLGTIVNHGTGGIYATSPTGRAIDKTAGTLALTNAGTISGAIASAGGNDTVVNNGLIQGNIDLGAGNDTYSGVGRLDGTLSGGAGNDTLTGGLYDDNLNGGADNDTLNGGSGADMMTGGSGDDTFYVDTQADRVIEAVSGGTDKVYASVSYALRAGQQIERLEVNPDADYANTGINLGGNEYQNILVGNAAANRLDGKGGADTMIGGDGDDIYYVDNLVDVVSESANQGIDTVFTTVDFTLTSTVEILRAQGTADLTLLGSSGSQTIVGNAGANYIDGRFGADEMTGGAGNDTYIVDDAGDEVLERVNGGTDEVRASVSFTVGNNVETLVLTGVDAIAGTGSKSANTIVGNEAANTIAGMGGFDTLTGNEGADTFVFSTKLDAAMNFATITDFEHGVDRIALDFAFRRVGSTGALEEQFFTASAPTTRDHHILYDQASGVLSYDIDGNGVRPAIAFAQVTPDIVLDHTDFLIV